MFDVQAVVAAALNTAGQVVVASVAGYLGLVPIIQFANVYHELKRVKIWDFALSPR